MRVSLLGQPAIIESDVEPGLVLNDDDWYAVRLAVAESEAIFICFKLKIMNLYVLFTFLKRIIFIYDISKHL